ncbi:MAG: uroporphyrinogen decarboxylase family protein [Clostridia bacterium]
MTEFKEFSCPLGSHSTIPRELLHDKSLDFKRVFTERDQIAKLSVKLQEIHQSGFTTLPTCCTLEIEALGGILEIPADVVGPKVIGFAYANEEDINRLIYKTEFTLRQKENFAAIRLLHEQGKKVCFNIAGPLTVLNGLMELGLVFRILRRQKKSLEAFFQYYRASLMKIVEEAKKQGADIISYGDPICAVSIVGPKVYQEIMESFVVPFLRNWNVDNLPLHLCPKTSLGLIKAGYATTESYQFTGDLTYSEALLLANDVDKTIFGQRCLNSDRKTKIQNVFALILNEENIEATDGRKRGI